MIISRTELAQIPDLAGVYQFLDKKEIIIYIGKAVNLKKRVSFYFKNYQDSSKTKKIKEEIAKINLTITDNEFEALILEAKLIKKHKPKFNVSWRDDKQYIYLTVTREDFSKIILSRKPKKIKGRIFGPFPSTYIVRDLVKLIREIFPFCTQKAPLKRICLYREIGLCNPCPYEIINSQAGKKTKLKAKYYENIRNILKLLNGKTQEVNNLLTKKMKHSAKMGKYEEAAFFRDRLRHLKILFSARFHAEDYIANPLIAIDSRQKELRDLSQILHRELDLKTKTKSIECYDISNLSGKMATGSMVTFINGVPDKSRYRHFRIRGENKPNDFEMLKEVFHRRLKHSEWTLPDLFVVDGGSLQLQVLLSCLNFFQINVPAISLAKKHEDIYLKKDNAFKLLRLERSSPALKLIQRLRDEAHRFAHRYHQKLRLKNLLSNGQNSLK